jgi:SPP1 gp7 family putative phage head morphogenesis protein
MDENNIKAVEGNMSRMVPIYGPSGNIISAVEKNFIPAVDPYFFFTTAYRGNISADEIERRPYQYHPWTHAAAWAIVRNTSRLPIIVKRRGEKGKEDKDPTGILALIDRPNPFMTRTTFIQNLLLYLLLPGSGSKNNRKDMPGGQAFITPSIPDLGKYLFSSGKLPDMIFPWSSDTIRVSIPSKVGGEDMAMFRGWNFYSNKKKIASDLPNDALIRIRFTNPYDWFNGMSLSEPAILAMTTDIKSDIFNVKFYDNSGVPSGILYMDKPLTKEQKREQLANFNEEFAGGGGGNNSRTAMLPQGMKYEKIAMTAADMQFVESKKDSFEKVLACFGMNKIGVGKYEDINYATIEIGRRFLWSDCYQPIADLALEPINSSWMYYIKGGDYELAFDYSGVEELRPDYTKQATVAKIFVDMGMPVEMACRLNEIAISEEDLLAAPWLKEEPKKPSPFSLVNGPGDKEPPPAPVPAPKMLVKSFKMNEYSADARREYQDNYQSAHHEPLENTFKGRITRAFIGQRNRMQDRVDAWAARNQRKIMKASNEPSIDDFMLERIAEEKRIWKAIEDLMKGQINGGMARLEQELGTIDWGKADPLLHKYAEMEREAMKDINTTTFNVARDKIGSAITQAVDENMTVGETSRLIKDSISDVFEIRTNQAVTIARTETGKIQSGLRFDVFRDEGIEYQMWLTANDENVRLSHQENDGKVRRLGTPFPNGLSYPQEAGGPAEEVINCRCVAVATTKPEE